MRGYTRSGAFGPIAEVVDLHGGSIERVFRKVDLPLALLDNPDMPLPLAEQFKVLKAAGHEVGDPYIGATLGRFVKVSDLGAYGAWMCEAPTLASLIDRCSRGIGLYLQTATRIELRVLGPVADVSIAFLDSRDEPWLQNELLGISYLIDCVRQFAGSGWSPKLICSTCIGAASARALEKLFSAPVHHGAEVSSIQFDAALLTQNNPRSRSSKIAKEPVLPNALCYRNEVAALISISLLERQPKIDWIASKLSMSRRSLQRALAQEGCNFSRVLEGLLKDQAIALLQSTKRSITEIGFNLGYNDSAHFTRAFRAWTGLSPSQFRSTRWGPSIS